jgi:hypothetical protein
MSIRNLRVLKWSCLTQMNCQSLAILNAALVADVDVDVSVRAMMRPQHIKMTASLTLNLLASALAIVPNACQNAHLDQSDLEIGQDLAVAAMNPVATEVRIVLQNAAQNAPNAA